MSIFESWGQGGRPKSHKLILPRGVRKLPPEQKKSVPKVSRQKKRYFTVTELQQAVKGGILLNMISGQYLPSTFKWTWYFMHRSTCPQNFILLYINPKVSLMLIIISSIWRKVKLPKSCFRIFLVCIIRTKTGGEGIHLFRFLISKFL